MKSLSILIPIYNEEESLQALFDELKFSFENNQSIEIIFINDGSSDMSQKVIENEIANRTSVRLRDARNSKLQHESRAARAHPHGETHGETGPRVALLCPRAL